MALQFRVSVVLTAVVASALVACKSGDEAGSIPSLLARAERTFQLDADQARLEHLVYWTGLIEEYQSITGRFPFQNDIDEGFQYAFVLIATGEQREYMAPGSSKYREDLDFNSTNRFDQKSVKAFVAEIESALGRTIKEKYDIQRAPTRSPIGYHYFVEANGYLLWVTCPTCGVTPISTLLGDGFTPTVNIGSEKVQKYVTKALLREDMLKHPVFQGWVERGYNKEGFVRAREAQFESDTKIP